MVTLKTADQIAKMREAGKIVAVMLAATRDAVKPGVTTAELDRIAADVLARAGATSSFLGYYGYPATICTSVNDQIVHGIPGKRRLKEGDIVGIDAGAIVDGWHADAAITVPVGRISAEAEKLIAVTREALVRGIAAAKVGNRLGDVGAAVQQYVESQGFSVVRNYVGHGIGRAMHEEPQVPNYGSPDLGRVIKEGLCIAIEPMVNVGGVVTRLLEDSWTVVTEDGSLSAHFEHTLACGPEGPVVLTREGGSAGAREARAGRTKDAAGRDPQLAVGASR
ncbi:MAG TPA: type I methionyl aminopeptidase [Candidatus Limnocylindria bacterium]|nr:type I methionyl aminopeptidase [Candidatus Limnocylindria bacterium]